MAGVTGDCSRLYLDVVGRREERRYWVALVSIAEGMRLEFMVLGLDGAGDEDWGND